MTMAKYFLSVVVLAASLRIVLTISQEDISSIDEAMLPYIVECSKEFGVEEQDLKELKESGSSDKINNCIFACIMKKAKTIDDKGMFVPEVALEQAKSHLQNEEAIEKAEKAITECLTVNDEDVSDGEAGCDRAELLYACLIKYD